MVVVLGSTNLDQTGEVTRLPRPGETVSGHGFAVAPGGKGANQALAARRGGAHVRFHSAVGDDGFADTALSLLRADGVVLDGVTRADLHTGIALILVDAEGENVIAVLPGANGAIGPDHATRALTGARPGEILMLQQEIPFETNRLALDRARSSGLRTMLNIAPFVPETGAIAGKADILVANETEFALLTGTRRADLESAMLAWASGHDQMVIVTLGGDGARIADRGRLIAVAASPVEVIDTVGAGDTFCGYFAAALEAGALPDAAARRAVRAASLACTRRGAQSGMPFAGEVA